MVLLQVKLYQNTQSILSLRFFLETELLKTGMLNIGVNIEVVLSIYLVLGECICFYSQGVLRDRSDLEMFDNEFKEAYAPRKIDFFEDEDDSP